MPALKYWDATSGTYKEIFSGQKGDKGDPGEQGPPGTPGSSGSLDSLSDVIAPSDTPVNKVLGTTGTGVWGPIDPPATGISQAQGDARYVNLDGDTMSASLTLTAGTVKAPFLESQAGVKAMGLVTDVTTPVAAADGANKGYVDSRIWSGTQAQYNAIAVKDPAVLYVVVG